MAAMVICAITEYLVKYLFLIQIADCSLTCLSGIDIPTPRDTTRVVQCGDSEYCSLEQYITPNGYVRHKADCKDKHNCGGVTVQSTDMVICSECCDTNLCSATACKNQGYDLQYGPLCYHCDYPLDHPDHCDTIRQCQHDEFCSVTQIASGQYLVGCSTLQACAAISTKSICSTCCSNTLCNRNCTNNFPPFPPKTTVPLPGFVTLYPPASVTSSPVMTSPPLWVNVTQPVSGTCTRGKGSGCYYKGLVYPLGYTWKDGCAFSCTCADDCLGQYSCRPLCVTWNLPPVCSLNPPVPGKCCSTPSCPAGIVIKYPPGYAEV